MVVVVDVQSQSLKRVFLQSTNGILMEKVMMKYLVLVKAGAGKGGEFWGVFSKMPDEPMKGVMVESSWSLFGYWDYVIFFKADSNDSALHFVGEVLRAIPGVAETSTSPMTVLKEHQRH